MMCNISSNCLTRLVDNNFGRGRGYACVFHINKTWISASSPKDNSVFSLEPYLLNSLLSDCNWHWRQLQPVRLSWRIQTQILRKPRKSLICYKKGPQSRETNVWWKPLEDDWELLFLVVCVLCVHAQNFSVTFLGNKEIEMMRFGFVYVEDQRISVSQAKWIRRIHLLTKWLFVKRENGSSLMH